MATDFQNLLLESVDVTTISKGGYRYEFKSTELLDEFICPVCNLVSYKPHQVTCCGKIYCKSCLRQLRLSQNFECKSCRENLTKKYFKDTNTERRIMNLQIYCTNKDKTCQWSGSIRDIEEHLQECSYQQKECPNKCSELIYPVELEEHLNEKCTHRSFKCSYCNMTDIHKVITGNHNGVCPEVPIPCPNKECDETHPRKSMENHREECPKEIVTCPFSNIGCKQKMKREKLSLHTQTTVECHLDLAMTQIVSLNSDADEMMFRITQLSKQIEELKLRPSIAQRLVIKMSKFEMYKSNGKTWHSPGFYSNGYKMSLSIVANGGGDGEGTHVSCLTCLMPGEYDDILEWPFQGEVTIELLNQLKDGAHEKTCIKYNATTPEIYSNKVVGEIYGPGFGKSQFIPHSDLFTEDNYCQYLKDDTLYFRVTTKVMSKTKPWLMTNPR